MIGRTFTDFSQLSKGMFKKNDPKGMFKKNDPAVEAKPPLKKMANGDDALAYFGLNAPEAPAHAPRSEADNGRMQALEANVAALRAESAALKTAMTDAARKAADLARELTAERQMRSSTEAERDRLRGEVLQLREELEEALTAPRAERGAQATGDDESVREVRMQGLLKPPATAETFPGEVREHILAVLLEAWEAAQRAGRERRASVLQDVLAANKPDGELERRRKELKQIIKDTGSFIDARTISALEKIGFRCVSGNKHWKLDYSNIRITIAKTPSDHRAARNMATEIVNRCF